MRRINKKLISWVVVLNLILGFIPITSAQSNDAVNSADHCALSVTESPISMFSSDIEKELVNYCHDSAVCAVHYSCAPLQSSIKLAVAIILSPTMANGTILAKCLAGRWLNMASWPTRINPAEMLVN